ncbi:putative Adenylate kinase 7 [Blattamonas nauphoetae]|uniref:Adenylate kinase 7 n=1 Tax=Blattamonas nauphoetae TaxID=2049346 RepID=A0ABQ9YKQ6_9EUKA|nr:putative Adenylate kinase 7 [Blattamonas nauphoetae]
MKILISPVDSYLGRALFRFFSKTKREEKHQLVGMVRDEDNPQFKPNSIKKWISLNDEEDFQKTILECDAYLFDLRYTLEAASKALEILTETKFKKEKSFIVLSSFLTWAKTEKNDPEEAEEEGGPVIYAPFTEEDRKKRCPHQLVRETIRFERLVAHKNGIRRGRFHTCILCMGHLYGDGEDMFHPYFRQSWEGLDPALPLYGNGENVLPCIHVRDVCQIAGHILTEPAEEPLLICVDEGRYTQRQIVKTISEKMGTGALDEIDEEASLQIPQSAYFMADVPMAGNIVHSFPFEWHSQNFINNIDKIIEEFKLERRLTPLKILVHGPPCSGKTELSTKIADEYKLQLISKSTLIRHFLDVPDPAPQIVKPKKKVEEEEAEEAEEEEQVQKVKVGDLADLQEIKRELSEFLISEAKKTEMPEETPPPPPVQKKSSKNAPPPSVVPPADNVIVFPKITLTAEEIEAISLPRSLLFKMGQRMLRCRSALQQGYVFDGLVRTKGECKLLFQEFDSERKEGEGEEEEENEEEEGGGERKGKWEEGDGDVFEDFKEIEFTDEEIAEQEAEAERKRLEEEEKLRKKREARTGEEGEEDGEAEAEAEEANEATEEEGEKEEVVHKPIRISKLVVPALIIQVTASQEEILSRAAARGININPPEKPRKPKVVEEVVEEEEEVEEEPVDEEETQMMEAEDKNVLDMRQSEEEDESSDEEGDKSEVEKEEKDERDEEEESPREGEEEGDGEKKPVPKEVPARPLRPMVFLEVLMKWQELNAGPKAITEFGVDNDIFAHSVDMDKERLRFEKQHGVQFTPGTYPPLTAEEEEDPPVFFFPQAPCPFLYSSLADGQEIPSAFSSSVTWAGILKYIGPVHNYGPTPEELEVAERKKTEELEERVQRMEMEKRSLEEEKSKREHERMDTNAKREEEVRRQLEIRQIEVEKTTRQYFMSNIVTCLTKGLQEIAKLRPDDAIDSLAEFIMDHIRGGDVAMGQTTGSLQGMSGTRSLKSTNRQARPGERQPSSQSRKSPH